MHALPVLFSGGGDLVAKYSSNGCVENRIVVYFPCLWISPAACINTEKSPNSLTTICLPPRTLLTIHHGVGVRPSSMAKSLTAAIDRAELVYPFTANRLFKII